MHRAHRLRRAPLIGLLVALGLAFAAESIFVASASATTASYASNCGVNLRARTSTGSSIRRVISADTVVTVTGKVSGGSWKADCASNVSGSSWFVITAIKGTSVKSLLGVSAVYAAVGLFRAASTGYTEGVDVSHWQGAIDFNKVRGAGRRFVIAKATEGTTYTDSNYATNRSKALAASVRFTGYHFARPGTAAGDAVKEADHFIGVLGLQHGMMIPALDLELSGGLGVSALQTWAKTFVTRVYNRLGVKPMIYSNPGFWRSNMGDTSWFANNGYRVWIANWKVSSPTVPASNWGGRGWSFWQYSNCGSVAGVSGCVDLDRIKGSDFSKLTY
jgi:GH25 family lysozyme M1 (1,4-beta-N-acetylmuramidase)